MSGVTALTANQAELSMGTIHAFNMFFPVKVSINL